MRVIVEIAFGPGKHLYVGIYTLGMFKWTKTFVRVRQRPLMR